MFEKASRLKLRFSFRGSLSVEDLWDLPVEDLDGIFKSLNVTLKAASEESLLGAKNKTDEELVLKVDIIKRVVEVKLAEKQARLDARARSDEKQKLLGILATKKAAALENLSEADIEARIAALG